MGRHHLDEPRVRVVIERLVDEFLLRGSVNAVVEALCAALERVGSDRKIYSNRVHQMLSDDRVTVNTSTLETVESALEHVLVVDDHEAGGRRRAQIRTAFAGHSAIGEANPVATLAEELGFPPAVVRTVAADDSGTDAASSARTHGKSKVAARIVDWSFQDDAVEACIRGLSKGPGRKVGLVIPTAGGKTRMGLRVALDVLDPSAENDSVVIWVTHRKRLQKQARRALQQLLKDDDQVPEKAAEIFSSRIKFIMIKDLDSILSEYGDRIEFVIVDEAHHAAAKSYAALFDGSDHRGLFLTATPNRMDDLPIGIDEIAYTITYRELFDRGCIVEPTFDQLAPFESLDWDTPSGLHDLADYLLDRMEDDLSKVLVAVTRRERAENLYRALMDVHDERQGHPLAAEDIAFCHGLATSDPGVNPDSFLDEFAGRPSGLLVATSQLLGEGFDDPGIDGVVVTYPSESIGHLMQVAGRALRSAPGKLRAHVIQVRESPLEYHFDERWLYQDISDRLRPNLFDFEYTSKADLSEKLQQILEQRHVASAVHERVMTEVAALPDGADISLMLSGLPYFGNSSEFESEASWGTVLAAGVERERFLRLFNSISDLNADIKDPHAFLAERVERSSRSGSIWKSYMDLAHAMESARRELAGIDTAGAKSRPYRSGLSTTWLRYVTWKYVPAIPLGLELFLAEAVNRSEVAARFLNSPEDWAAGVRIPLPLAGHLAYLLTDTQAEWLMATRTAVVRRLRDADPETGFEQLAAWRASLSSAPIPMAVVQGLEHLLRAELFDSNVIVLREIRPPDQ